MKNIKDIEEYICKRKGIAPEYLHKHTRLRVFTEPRQIIMSLAMQNGYSEERAARFFGLNHATAHYSKNTVDNLRATNRIFNNEYTTYQNHLTTKINAPGKILTLAFFASLRSMRIGNRFPVNIANV
jgi:chromosomal replication initiation ATPase DnaA